MPDKDHPDLVEIFNEIADVRSCGGHFQDALTYYQQALGT